jgi:hypothetical protein
MTSAYGGSEGRDAPEPVGSVAEEAAKLIGALSGWAREHAEGATGDPSTGTTSDCTYCPVCRGIHLIRETSPEVTAHLGAALVSVLQALGEWRNPTGPPPGWQADAQAHAQAQAQGGSESGSEGTARVQHIDLEDDVDQGTGWTEGSARTQGSGDGS